MKSEQEIIRKLERKQLVCFLGILLTELISVAGAYYAQDNLHRLMWAGIIAECGIGMTWIKIRQLIRYFRRMKD